MSNFNKFLEDSKVEKAVTWVYKGAGSLAEPEKKLWSSKHKSPWDGGK